MHLLTHSVVVRSIFILLYSASTDQQRSEVNSRNNAGLAEFSGRQGEAETGEGRRQAPKLTTKMWYLPSVRKPDSDLIFKKIR